MEIDREERLVSRNAWDIANTSSLSRYYTRKEKSFEEVDDQPRIKVRKPCETVGKILALQDGIERMTPNSLIAESSIHSCSSSALSVA